MADPDRLVGFDPFQAGAFWSRRTALQVARELDALNVYYLEEPLPRRDVEGLAEIADRLSQGCRDLSVASLPQDDP